MINEFIASRTHQINRAYRQKINQFDKINEIQGRLDSLSRQLEELRNIQANFLNKSVAYKLFYPTEYIKIKREKERADEAIPSLVTEISRTRLELTRAQTRVAAAREERRKGLKLLEDKDYVISYLMDEDPTITSTIGFMLQAVDYDPGYIIYDKTNSNIVYEAYVKKLLTSSTPEQLASLGYTEREAAAFTAELQALLEEIQTPKPFEEGKYKMPQKYLYEVIRKAAKDQEPQVMIEGLYSYKRLKAAYDKDFGIALDKLYSDKDNYLFLHSTNYRGYAHSEAQADTLLMSIMQGGVLLSSMGNEVGKIEYTTLSNTPKDGFGFMYLAEFARQGDVVVISIPKADIDKAKPILGSNHSKLTPDNPGYILPKYVVGYFRDGVYQENPIPKTKRNKYQYTLAEKSEEEEKE